jgi:hypothetical protein
MREHPEQGANTVNMREHVNAMNGLEHMNA